MEMTTTTTITRNPRRLAAMQGLAVVGFITLIVLGIMLAIYSARFVPAAISRVGSAAVYLSQVFVPDHANNLTVVPQIPFSATSTASTTVLANASTTVTSPLLGNTPAPVVTTSGPSHPSYYGQADLSVHITEVGYLQNTGDISSFVPTKTIPSNKDGAVKFTIANNGTNVSGDFKIQVSIRTDSGTKTDTGDVVNVLPGSPTSSYAVFNANRSGTSYITLSVDTNNQISESSETNNSDGTAVTVQ
jgi:hypothetical protein